MKTAKLRDDSQSLRRARQRVKIGSPRAVAMVLGSITLVGATILGSAWLLVREVAFAVAPDRGGEHAGLQATLLSARRVPVILSEDVRFSDFENRLESFVTRLPPESCFAVDVEGRRMVSFRPTSPLLPASNMKVLVASVALEVLGSDYRFGTSLYGTIDNGVITGDLSVVGGGDPAVQSVGYSETQRFPNTHVTQTNRFVEALRQLVVSRISGSIIGDESRYDTERWAPTLGLGVRMTEVGPLGALLINDGVVLGDPLKPDNPALSAVRELTRIFVASGIAVDGFPRVQNINDKGVPLVTIQSAPLSDLVADLLTNSDNNMAELILKELGWFVTKEGSREAGISVVRNVLENRGYDTSSLVMVDGAGLDRGNRFTCDLVQAVLVNDTERLSGGLALAGRSGTLKDLFIGNPMEGRLRGKTGTLSGAKALAGYVPYDESRSLTYTLILNGPNVANQTLYRPLWNSMGDIFARLRATPSVNEIAPFQQ